MNDDQKSVFIIKYEKILHYEIKNLETIFLVYTQGKEYETKYYMKVF